MRKECFIFSLVFIFINLAFIENVDAYQLGVSPAEVRFVGDVNEEICKNILIFSKDYLGQIRVYDNLDNHGIDIFYSKVFVLNLKKKIEVCVRSDENVESLGYLMFKAVNGGIEVGSRLIVDLGQESFDEERPLTGRAISRFNDVHSEGGLSFALLLMLELFLLLMLMFILLVLSAGRGDVMKRKSTN